MNEPITIARGGGNQQIVVMPSSPTAIFTNLYRNRLYKIQAVPGHVLDPNPR